MCQRQFSVASDAEKFEPPLSFLFQDSGTNSDSATLLYKLHTSENIQWVTRALSTHVNTVHILLSWWTNMFYLDNVLSWTKSLGRGNQYATLSYLVYMVFWVILSNLMGYFVFHRNCSVFAFHKLLRDFQIMLTKWSHYAVMAVTNISKHYVESILL